MAVRKGKKYQRLDYHEGVCRVGRDGRPISKGDVLEFPAPVGQVIVTGSSGVGGGLGYYTTERQGMIVTRKWNSLRADAALGVKARLIERGGDGAV